MKDSLNLRDQNLRFFKMYVLCLKCHTRCNSLLKCVTQPEIAKKTKTSILGFKIIQDHQR